MILVADIGTTFFKAGLVNDDGTLVCSEKTTIKNHLSTVNSTDNWLVAFKEVLGMLDIEHRVIDYVIMCGNGPTLAPCQGGEALLYSHREAVEEAKYIKDKTGVDLQVSMFLPKAMYIKNRKPELWNATETFLSTPEFVSYKLTGKARTVMALEGLEKWYWNEDLLDNLGLEKDKFPAFIKSGELLGKVTNEASSVYGIKPGTPVLAGCPDFVCAIVGSGAMHPGMICNRSGTSEGINYCSSTKAEKPIYMSYRHPNGKDWNISYVMPQSGLALEEVRARTGLNKMSYDDMFDYVQSHNDEKSEAVKEVCLNLCCNVKEAINKVADGEVSEIRLTGGPSKSDFLNKMRADITGVKVCTLQCPEAGLSGLGVIALASIQKEDIVAVADRVVKIKQIYLPENIA